MLTIMMMITIRTLVSNINILYIWLCSRVIKFAEMRVNVPFSFFCVGHYMRFHDFLLSNNTDYHFVVLNILRAENVREKAKTRSSPKLTDIR